MSTPGYIYLASPYSDPNPAVEKARYEAVRRFAAATASEGEVVLFSPILHWHEASLTHDMPGDALFWLNYNRVMQRFAVALWVLRLDGWRLSTGVLKEIKYAVAMNQPIEQVEPIEG